MKKILSLVLSTCVMCVTVAFASTELANTTWSLDSYNGSGGTSGFLSFDDTTMFSKFCNNVSQGYTLSGSMLYSSGLGVSTMMYCEGLPMILENNFIISNTGTALTLSGENLTITTSGKNVYTFKKQIITLGDLHTTCIQAFDGCGNMCTRDAGETARACTKMGCSIQKNAQCMMSTNDIDLNQSVCTMEYNPVCGSKQVECVQAPCDPIQQTYGNTCSMEADKATLVHTGECNTDIMVGNDKDKHGCIGSAGYSWSQSKNECVRVWEYQATALEKAYDLAYNNGITTMKSLQEFRANDTITRQEAAKMFVAMAENVFNKKYASYPDECNKTYTDEKMFDSTLKNDIYESCAHGIMKGSKGYFMPNDQLTKGQTLAIMMRTIDGWQDSEATAQPRWMPYADKAQKLGYMTSLNTKDGESYITRGDVITWIHTFYEASLTK